MKLQSLELELDGVGGEKTASDTRKAQVIHLAPIGRGDVQRPSLRRLELKLVTKAHTAKLGASAPIDDSELKLSRAG